MMKKEYIKPTTESVVYKYETQPLMHSDTHIGAKGISFDEEDSEVDNNNAENNNLWDE